MNSETPTETTECVENIAKIIDPEAFGLPPFVEPGSDYLSDRDEARAKARSIIAHLAGEASIT